MPKEPDVLSALEELVEAAEELFINASDRNEVADKKTGDMFIDWSMLCDAIATAKTFLK